MIDGELNTDNPNVVLVPIDVERDAAKGVEWLAGAAGRETLRLMGVIAEHNHESNLQAENKRLRDIIANPNEEAWMIQYDGTIVGIVEIDLKGSEYITDPAISIMIGDSTTRGKGVGSSAVARAVRYLHDTGYTECFARHLTDNNASANLLSGLGFEDLDDPYTDADGLEWQNMRKDLAYAA